MFWRTIEWEENKWAESKDIEKRRERERKKWEVSKVDNRRTRVRSDISVNPLNEMHSSVRYIMGVEIRPGHPGLKSVRRESSLKNDV